MTQLLLQLSAVAPGMGDLAKQGPVIGLLLAAIWYFYTKQAAQDAAAKASNDKHEAAIQAANDKLERYMNEDREKLLTAINNNTAVMRDNTTVMKKITEFLETRKAA